jgi:hypothetical protein
MNLCHNFQELKLGNQKKINMNNNRTTKLAYLKLEIQIPGEVNNFFFYFVFRSH